MQRRYDALIQVQSETLDHLAEAVAVFGSDGRVAAAQSGVPADVEAVARCARAAPACRGGDRAGARRCTTTTRVWRSLRASVTAIDNRETVTSRASSGVTAA